MGLISYVKTIWKAGKSGGTPITPDSLNNIEDGIEQATNELNDKETRIADLETDVSQINSDLSTTIIKYSNDYTYNTIKLIYNKYMASIAICGLSNITETAKFIEILKLPPESAPRCQLYYDVYSDNSARIFINTDGAVKILFYKITNVSNFYAVITYAI